MPYSQDEFKALTRKLSDEITLSLQRLGLSDIAFTLLVFEVGPGGGHLGYASTVERAGMIDSMRGLLTKLEPTVRN